MRTNYVMGTTYRMIMAESLRAMLRANHEETTSYQFAVEGSDAMGEAVHFMRSGFLAVSYGGTTERVNFRQDASIEELLNEALSRSEMS